MTLITLSEEAKNQIKNIADNNPDKLIKFGVASGGCSGFTYKMDIIDADDLQPEDEIENFDDVKLVIDGSSLFLIVGTEIGYDNSVMGSYFTFDNPNASAGCGCGTSFSA